MSLFLCRAQYAFNPKDVNRMRRTSVPDVSEPSEAEIKERIGRLSHIFSNTVHTLVIYYLHSTNLKWLILIFKTCVCMFLVSEIASMLLSLIYLYLHLEFLSSHIEIDKLYENDK